jgi:hypothetical protein
MKKKLRAVGMMIALAGAITSLPSAKADDWNKETVVTLGTSVAVPGQILEPGQYVFKLFDSNSDRNVVQIFNEDRSQLITTVMAVPAQRTETGDVAITLDEQPTGTPETIHKWFFAGEQSGVEFVYPDNQQ